MSKNNHGGVRPGAGRPPGGPESRNVPKSIKVTQEMADYLSERGTGIIQTVLQRTKDFKEWREQR